MRHSIAWPVRGQQRVRIEIEALAARDADLPAHEIDAGHHLGDRVLDLQARVHLEEVEPAVLVEQELDRAGVGVADRSRDGGRRRRHRRAQRRRHGERRRLLDDFLMTPLNRALALDERQDGAVMRRRAAALRCGAAASAGARDTPRHRRTPRRPPIAPRARRPAEIRRIEDRAHAFSAAARHGFHEQRIADRASPSPNLGAGARRRRWDLRCPAPRARRRAPAGAPPSCCPSARSPRASGR